MARGDWCTRRTLLLAAVGGALGGCGFHPMYGAASNGGMGPAQAGLAEISVDLIPERAGQLLREALQARFERGGSGVAARYDLSVSYGILGDTIAIQPDTSITRVRLVGSATWTLRAQDPQRRTLATGTARAVDAFNVLDQQNFTTDLENEAVQRRVSEAVADQIALQLAAYFDKHAGP